MPMSDSNTLSLKGFIFSAQQQAISSSSVIDEFESRTEVKCPEMAYFANYLKIEHPASGLVLR